MFYFRFRVYKYGMNKRQRIKTNTKSKYESWKGAVHISFRKGK